MDKSPDAFRTISEVADWLGTPTHVLRFWESRFSQVKPVKRAGGRRYYRPADVALLGGIKKLLHEDGLTIRGVQKILREEGVKHVTAMSAPVEGWDENDVIDHVASVTPDNVVPLATSDEKPATAPSENAEMSFDLLSDIRPDPDPRIPDPDPVEEVPVVEDAVADMGESGPEQIVETAPLDGEKAESSSLPSFLRPETSPSKDTEFTNETASKDETGDFVSTEPETTPEETLQFEGTDAGTETTSETNLGAADDSDEIDKRPQVEQSGVSALTTQQESANSDTQAGPDDLVAEETAIDPEGDAPAVSEASEDLTGQEQVASVPSTDLEQTQNDEAEGTAIANTPEDPQSLSDNGEDTTPDETLVAGADEPSGRDETTTGADATDDLPPAEASFAATGEAIDTVPEPTPSPAVPDTPEAEPTPKLVAPTETAATAELTAEPENTTDAVLNPEIEADPQGVAASVGDPETEIQGVPADQTEPDFAETPELETYSEADAASKDAPETAPTTEQATEPEASPADEAVIGSAAASSFAPTPEPEVTAAADLDAPHAERGDTVVAADTVDGDDAAQTAERVEDSDLHPVTEANPEAEDPITEPALEPVSDLDSEPEPVPEPEPELAAETETETETETAPEPDPDPQPDPQPERPVFVMPQMPEPPSGISDAEAVLSALAGGARVDPVRLSPIYDRLAALRDRMSSDNRRPPVN